MTPRFWFDQLCEWGRDPFIEWFGQVLKKRKNISAVCEIDIIHFQVELEMKINLNIYQTILIKIARMQ